MFEPTGMWSKISDTDQDKMMSKILIVEDDRRIGDLLSKNLAQSNYEVTCANNFREAKALNHRDFDLVVCDLLLPDGNGLEFCKLIKSRHSQLPVVILTALGTTDEKLVGFDAGADDYMVKPFEMRELLARIKVLLRRYQSKEDKPKWLQYADLKIDLETMAVSRAGKPIQLTPKEFKLLVYFLENPERVLDRVEIAEKVWQVRFDTGTNFIDVYVTYLRKKVDKSFETKLIHTKQGVGFYLSSKVL